MTIRECRHCKERFGTVFGYVAHRGTKGCKSARSLERYEAMWRGFGGIWWSPDLGCDDTTEDWADLPH